MTRARPTFRERYGPWALVAGASEGLGEAFAREAASRGVDLVLVARRDAEVQAVARRLRTDFRCEVRTLVGDLGDTAFLTAIEQQTVAIDIGLLVYNAALSIAGPFLDQPLAQHLRAVDINCRAPLHLTHTLARRMREHGRGGIVLLSSLTGFQGSPWLSTYGATKAFNLVLGEGLWGELQGTGIDVLVCAAGATTTPKYLASRRSRSVFFEPAPLSPDAVARETLGRLSKGPVLIPGRIYRSVAWLLRTLVTRRATVRLLGKAARSLRPQA